MDVDRDISMVTVFAHESLISAQRSAICKHNARFVQKQLAVFCTAKFCYSLWYFISKDFAIVSSTCGVNSAGYADFQQTQQY